MSFDEADGDSQDRGIIRKMGCVGDSRAAVMSATKLSSDELIRRSFNTDSCITLDCCCCSFTVKCFCPSEMTPNQKAKVFSILEQNMKGFYMKSSWGWNGDTKFDELFSANSHFLLCFLANFKTCCDLSRHNVPPSSLASSDEPCAFVHFRFEVDSRRPILYCYEIQLVEEVRGLNLGQKLLHILYKIAADNQMTQVILTVFKFNSPACAFFAKNGFKTDSSDPSRFGQSVDYSILSRSP
ncbi:N-alpha-acetyltransferase 40 [Echinococcus granulosus]|uniref:N-alpha-acetyltransferase 40 n=1 Tax=Echinococcus granulosus TaxID=6210 RepID=U6J0S8_ECHGR|nr:N-acetyltransferase [Echinococcus granulosus]EUB62126.1 N-acetyltransferase [Echinococcus granulosus]KAH9283417.1 N-alpha-acetyltransferase 40 [Echinococcus granulosus]CDS17608.1 n alpha acetyltransferase 40 NatD catalytic [Echinococcus granulosus]